MWRLYYHDRTTFSSTDGEWSNAPAWGVQGLAVLSDLTGYYRNTKDFYIFPPWASTPYGCDPWGAMDYLLRTGALKPHESMAAKPPEFFEQSGVKMGRSLDDDEWAEVQTWMKDDLPHKSARRADERP